MYNECLNDRRGLAMDWDNFAGAAGRNGEIRHDHPVLNRPGGAKTVIEVGGNIGVDAQAIIDRYSPRIFVFEPIPDLCEKLKVNLKPKGGNTEIHVSCYGLGGGVSRPETFYLREDPTHSQGDVGSFKQPDSTNHIHTRVQIKAYHEAMAEHHLRDHDVQLLTINCEGCEFELLEYLTFVGTAAHFEEIQLAWHPISIPQVMERRCRLRTLLSRTHRMTYSFWFNWESWLRKDISL